MFFVVVTVVAVVDGVLKYYQKPVRKQKLKKKII